MYDRYENHKVWIVQLGNINNTPPIGITQHHASLFYDRYLIVEPFATLILAAHCIQIVDQRCQDCLEQIDPLWLSHRSYRA